MANSTFLTTPAVIAGLSHAGFKPSPLNNKYEVDVFLDMTDNETAQFVHELEMLHEEMTTGLKGNLQKLNLKTPTEKDLKYLPHKDFMKLRARSNKPLTYVDSEAKTIERFPFLPRGTKLKMNMTMFPYSHTGRSGTGFGVFELQILQLPEGFEFNKEKRTRFTPTKGGFIGVGVDANDLPST